MPLTAYSTIGEWVADPAAGPALLEAMGEFGAMFGPDSPEPATAAFLTAMPLVKVPLMGMGGTFTVDDLDALLERFGSRPQAQVTASYATVKRSYTG